MRTAELPFGWTAADLQRHRVEPRRPVLMQGSGESMPIRPLRCPRISGAVFLAVTFLCCLILAAGAFLGRLIY